MWIGCGHCKQLAPIYDEVGKAFEGVNSVVIAKIDATSNDVNPKYGIKGFPTIKFFPANNKLSPIDFDGDRTKEDFVDFVKEHARYSICMLHSLSSHSFLVLTLRVKMSCKTAKYQP